MMTPTHYTNPKEKRYMTTTYPNLRNVPLEDLYNRLDAEERRKADVVVSRDAVGVSGGRFLVAETPNNQAMEIEPTARLLEQFSDRTKAKAVTPAHAPAPLLRDLHALANAPIDRTGDPLQVMAAEETQSAWLQAFDALVSAKLAHHAPERFLLRTFRNEEGQPYTGRAMLSQNFRIIDNTDVVLAILGGLGDAGLRGEDVVLSGDCTANRMHLRVTVPAVSYIATELMKGYRSPWRPEGEQSPVVWAGFVVSNSETGGGACSLAPRFVFEACSNGLTIQKDVQRAIHLGSTLETGTVDYSNETRDAAAKLVRLKVRDSVAQFLSPQYLEETITALEAPASTPLDSPVETVEFVAKQQGWTEEETSSVLGMFIKSGQPTVGGVMQAMTAHAQTVADPERAAEFEAKAISALQLLAA